MKTKRIAFGAGAIVSLIIIIMTLVYVSVTLSGGYIFGKKPIIMGSEDFEDDGIKQYALCIADRVDESNRNDIEKGDTVLYTMQLGKYPVITCGNVYEAGKTRLTLTNPADDELSHVIKRTDVKSEIVTVFNFTAPFLKVFTNKFVFYPLIILCAVIDVLWILLFVKRKISAE